MVELTLVGESTRRCMMYGGPTTHREPSTRSTFQGYRPDIHTYSGSMEPNNTNGGCRHHIKIHLAKIQLALKKT